MPRTIGISESAYGEVARLSAEQRKNLMETVSELVLAQAAASKGAVGPGPDSGLDPAPVPAAPLDDGDTGNEDEYWPSGEDGGPEDDRGGELDALGELDGLGELDELEDLAARIEDLEDGQAEAERERESLSAATVALAAGFDDHLAQHSAGELHPAATRQLVMRVLEAGGVPPAAFESAERMLSEGRWPDDPADAVALARDWVARSPAVEAAAAEAGESDDENDGKESDGNGADDSALRQGGEVEPSGGGPSPLLLGVAAAVGLLAMRGGIGGQPQPTAAPAADPLLAYVNNGG